MFGLPIDPAVVAGQGQFLQSPGLLEIVASDRSIIDWNSFSIDSHERVQVLLPNEKAVSLNRVIGAHPSEIFGHFESNGQVLLINPAGVLIGKEARLDLGSFLASTLDISNNLFLKNGDLEFSGSSDALVINQGDIQANDTDILLIGHNVTNNGRLLAPKGRVLIAAGSRVQMGSEMTVEGPGLVDNQGAIEAVRVHLSAGGNPFELAFNHSGTIDALGVSEQNGEVLLTCEAGQGVINGTIRAKDSVGNGGQVRVLGQYLKLGNESQIDVSGRERGGTVLFGGDAQGKNPAVRNASQSFIEKGARIYVDAIENGSGGKAIVWSNEATVFEGFISSRGGRDFGDGGFIEVSSLGILDYRGKIDLKAPQGQCGLLFLDPTDITISGVATTPGVIFGNPTTLPAMNSVNILNTDLNTALDSGSVLISTASVQAGPLGGTIQITAPISWSLASFLRLSATNDIEVDSSITASGAFAGDQIILAADSDASGVGTLTVRKTAFGAAAVAIETTNGGGINLSGAQIIVGNAASAGNTLVQTSAIGGAITLTSTGAISIDAGSAANTVIARIRSFGPMTINAASMTMTGGGMNDNFSYVFCNGSAQVVNISGALTLNGGTGPKTIAPVRKVELGSFLNGCSQTVNAGSILVDAQSGTSASTIIRSEGPQTISSVGDIVIQGGSGVSGTASITGASILGQSPPQTIQANNLILNGGSQSSATAQISTTTGQQTITIANDILMNGGFLNTNATASILQLSSTFPQTITAQRFIMDANLGSAVISNNSDQVINLSQDLQLIGNQDPLGTGGAALINGGTSATQSIFADTIILRSGQCINSGAQIRSFNDQFIDCATLISMESLFQIGIGEQAEIIYNANQTIDAGEIFAFGNVFIGKDTLFPVPNTVQTINVANDFTLRGFIDASLNVYSARVTPDGFDLQHLNVGNDFIIDANGGLSTVSTGSFSDCNVGGDFQLLGNNGFATINGTTNETINIQGTLTIDSLAGAGSANMGSFGPGFILNVQGDTYIGTNMSPGTQSINIPEDYSINIRGSLLIQGGSQPNAISQIVQTINFFSYFPGSIYVGTDLFILGGSGDGARAMIELLCGALDLRIGRDLGLQGGSGTGADAHIANYGLITIVDPMTLLPVTPTAQNIEVGRDISVIGGSAAGGTASAHIWVLNGPQKVSAGRNILLIGGANAPDNHALIGTGWFNNFNGVFPFFPTTALDLTISEINAAGNFTMQNGSGGSSAYVDTFASNIPPPAIFGFLGFAVSNTGTVAVQAAGNATFSTSVDLFEGPFTVGTHPLTVAADAPFAAGQLWTGSSNPVLAGTPVASSSPALLLNGAGGFSVDTGSLGGGISFTTVAGFNHLSSGERFVSSAFCNLTVGPTAVLNNLTISSISGDITIDPFHNILITNAITTAGNILIMAQNDIRITDTGSVAGGVQVQMVTDNQFPSPPLLGPGAFFLDAGGTVTAGGSLRIFTSRQSQNSILGLLNGSFFTPGTLFVDTNQEQWCTYYPSSFGGTPFTIFYKESLQQLVEQAAIIIDEFLVDLHSYDEYPGWIARFSMSYSDVELSERYRFSRRLLKSFNHPKSWTHLINP